MTFLEYLKTQTERPKNPAVGDYVKDFVDDVINDQTIPDENATYEDWIVYLNSENAIDEVLSSFEIAWNDYQKIKQSRVGSAHQ